MQAKLLEARFDFDDFLKQMRLLKNMGSLGGMLKLIPGMGNKIDKNMLEQGEVQLKRVETMINSMTKEERKNPDVLAQTPKRRTRIAKGSGLSEKDVSKLIADFTRMRKMMQQMGQGEVYPAWEDSVICSVGDAWDGGTSRSWWRTEEKEKGEKEKRFC